MGLKRKSKVTTKPEKKLKTVENSLITGCLSSSPQIEEDAYIDSLDVSICTMSKSSKSSDISSKDNEILNTSKEKDKISIEIQTQILMIELNEKFIIKRVTGDGNCFFRAILIASDNEEKEHLYLRECICNFMQKNTSLFESEEITKEFVIDYARRLKVQGEWACTMIIYATALYLDVCLEIYIPGHSKPQKFNEDSFNSTIFLLNADRNHFEVLKPIRFSGGKELLAIDIKTLKNRKVTKEKLNHMVGPNFSSAISFDYPKDGKSTYQEIYDYFTLGIFPLYISEMTGEERLANGRVKKTQLKARFKEKCRSYCLVQNRLTSISMSRLVYFSAKYQTKFTIPYNNEISSIIQHCHRGQSNHYPSIVTKSKLQSEGIAWIGMQTRIDCELQHCGCNLVSPTKSNSKKVSGYTRIISMSPYDRFQADTADLSSEIQKGCKEGKVLGWKKPCILFLVKDHFAKYLWSFLIQSKNAISVKTCLEQLFLDGYIPKILHTDNGSEFKGDVSKLLSKFNIKHVKGRPYNPKCQGLVENSNRYVKKYLQLAYLTNHQEVFNITSVLKEITLGYNKRPHSVTKVEPEKAFINPSNKLLVEIRERSVKYYNQAAQNFIKLEVNDRIGVSCKIEISEKGFLRLKKINLKGAKASFFHTLGIIEEVLDFGKVKIKVEFSLEDINVGETFYCDSQILHVLTLENYEGTLRVLSGNNLN